MIMANRAHDGCEITVKPQEKCYLCRDRGKLLYEDLQDRLYNVPGSWDLRRCTRPECGLVWLDPAPAPEDIPKLYLQYYTHQQNSENRDPLGIAHRLMTQAVLSAAGEYDMPSNKAGRLAGRIASRFGPFRESAEGTTFWLKANQRGRLLDVGCGAGEFLQQMQRLGWEVTGVEPDPAATATAKREGLEVYSSSLEEMRFTEASFDIITMSHVIEHLPDPLRILQECRRVLRPGGQLLLVTPNAASIGAARFCKHWVHWDPPRHIMVFTATALTRLVDKAGFEVNRVSTVARNAWWSWRASRQIQFHGHLPGGACRFHPAYAALAALFHLSEYRASRREMVGEELFLAASRH